MSRADLAIRPAVAADAAALSAIALAAKRHWGYPLEWIRAWADALTITPELLGEHAAWVACEGPAGEPLGCIVLVDSGACWQIEHMWVTPGQQGRGIGRRLLETALARARERPRPVRIESDPYAVGFYERCGARRVGSVPAPVLGVARELPLLEIPSDALRDPGTGRADHPGGP